MCIIGGSMLIYRSHVMLLKLKDYNTIGSLLPFHLLCMLGMIYESISICTSMYLYKIMIWTVAMTNSMCPCASLAASSEVYYWMNAHYIIMCIYLVSMWKLYKYKCIYVLVKLMLYHCILLIIMQYMASVLPCCAIWLCCVFDCLGLSLICYVCEFSLATVLLLLCGESYVLGNDRLFTVLM